MTQTLNITMKYFLLYLLIMNFNSHFWSEPRDLTPKHILYNALGRNLLHRLRYAKRHPHEQKFRMFHFPNPANTLVIDNTELLRLFNGAKAEWYEAVRQNAPQQRLDEIIRNARDNLHTEVWRMDRDMNSPVFRDVANVPPHILQAEFDTNFERFNPNVWHPEIGRFRDRDEAPWYRMHSRTTMDRLNEHGVDTRPVNRLGFINRDYDIVRIHDDGLKQYLMSPDNLRQIHEETIWKMTLLNYLAGGRNTHIYRLICVHILIIVKD